jgi:hypothetical protein
MNQDDIEYILELLEDAQSGQDWDSVLEAQQYLEEFYIKKSKSKFPDEEE